MTRFRRTRIDPETQPRGPRTSWAPATVSSPLGPNKDIDREMDAIVGALRERGPMTKREIREAVHSRFWGPGRLADALWLACRRGLVTRQGKAYSVTEPAKR